LARNRGLGSSGDRLLRYETETQWRGVKEGNRGPFDRLRANGREFIEFVEFGTGGDSWRLMEIHRDSLRFFGRPDAIGTPSRMTR
jgi:hypothetical protein